MPVQSYGLQYTMYKAENSQMFQNQYVIQDRGAREHNKRQVQAQNEEKLKQIQETEDLNGEDASRIDTHTEGAGGNGGRIVAPVREEEEGEEGSPEAAARDLEGKGLRLDITV